VLPASFSFADLNASFPIGRFWRFAALGDPTVDVFVSRDVDSFVLEREAVAVDIWLRSDKWAHVMRDSPGHRTEILAGLWGVKAYLDRGKCLILAALGPISER
jgi:hypothetical protein